MIILDVNELPMHTLVWFQNLACHELVDEEQIIGDHLLNSQEQEELTKKDIEHLKKEQDVLIVEKFHPWFDTEGLEKLISFVFQEVPDITDDMASKDKA